MIPNIHPHTIHAAHLRAQSVSGGKEWVGTVTSSGVIHTHWGKTGAINHHAAKPGDAWGLNKIITQKTQGKHKYVLIDEYDPQKGWKSQIKPNPNPNPNPNPVRRSSPPAPVPLVDWNNEVAPDASIKWDF